MTKDPLENLPEVTSFDVEAVDVNSNSTFTKVQYSGKMGVEEGKDLSPALRFSNVPEGTKSFVVQIYDPDAPTAAGFWHWTVINIRGDAEGLGTDAGNPNNKNLPNNAQNMLNDASFKGYVGAAPPKGETHRYFVLVSALDKETLDVDENATPSLVNFQLNNHIIGEQ